MSADRPENNASKTNGDAAGLNLLAVSKSSAEPRYVRPPTEPVKPRPPVEPPKPPTEPPKPPEPPKPDRPPVEPPLEPPKPPEQRTIVRPTPSAWLDVPQFADKPKKPPTVQPVPPLVPFTSIISTLPAVPVDVPTGSVVMIPNRPMPGLPGSPEERAAEVMISTPQLPPDPPEVPKPPEPVKPKFPTPTGIFTGQGDGGSRADRLYDQHFSTGKHASPDHAHLISNAIGLKVDIEPVGTGKDRGMKGHQTEMVAPKDPFHVGQWKYDVPGKTILAGHVSFKGTPGPLYELRKLGVHKGVSDTVTVESKDGKKTEYAFAGRTILKDPHDQKAWDKLFAPGNPDKKELVVVTCCGPVDSNGLHKWRLIVHLREQNNKSKASIDSDKPSHSSKDASIASGSVSAVLVPDSKASSNSRESKETTSSIHLLMPREAPKLIETPMPIETPKIESPKAMEEPKAIVPPKPVEAPKPVEPKPVDSQPVAASAHAELPQSSNNSVRVMSASSNSGFKTRVIYDSRFSTKRGSMTGISAEVGGDFGNLSFAKVNSNFSFIDNDRTKLQASFGIGYGTGNLFQSADLPIGGLSGLSLSSRFVLAQRVARDTTWYLGGGLGLNPGNKIGHQEFLETGAVRDIGRLSLRAGFQGSHAEGHALTTYGVFGLSYKADRNTQLDLGFHKTLNTNKNSDKVFFGISHRF